ncbi:hypothetical protein FHG87_015096 [Trinorchestia longiramus]|nr:hypothetical protein FHG87_015096 [Trinorchestia longiramus]
MSNIDVNERVKKLVHQKISEIISAQTDLSDEARDSLLSDHMKVFSKNWDAVLQSYREQLSEGKQAEQEQALLENEADPLSLCENQPTEPSPIQLDEELEEEEQDVNTPVVTAAITYEAALIATTRQRSTAPAKLAKLLGSSTRFASLAVKEQCVDLPHRPLIESATLKNILDAGWDKSPVRCDVQNRMEECKSAISGAALAIQAETERLDNIATALEIVVSNTSHPTHKLLSKIT